MYYPFGSYRIWGGHSGGGETPVSVQVFIQKFSRAFFQDLPDFRTMIIFINRFHKNMVKNLDIPPIVKPSI
jgi:hypothetical protein